MKIKTRKSVFLSLLLTLMACLCCWGGWATKTASAEEVALARTATVSDLENEEYFKPIGSSVRKDTPVGIRFGIVIDKDVYEQIIVDTSGTVKSNVSTGILVLPSDLVNGDLASSANVSDEDTSNLWYAYVDDNGNETNYMVSYVYLWDIPEMSYNRYISFCGYVKIGDETYYTKTLERSPASVVLKAYNTETIDAKLQAVTDEIVGKTMAIHVAEDGAITRYNAVDANLKFCYDEGSKYVAEESYTLSRKGAKLTVDFSNEVKSLAVDCAEGLSYNVITDENNSFVDCISVKGLAYNGTPKVLSAADMESGSYTFNMNDNAWFFDSTTYNLTKEYVPTIAGVDESYEQYYLHLTGSGAAAYGFSFRSFSNRFVAGNQYKISFIANANATLAGDALLLQMNSSAAQISGSKTYNYTKTVKGNLAEYSFTFVAAEELCYPLLFTTKNVDAYISEITLTDVSTMQYTVNAKETPLNLNTKQVIAVDETTAEGLRHVKAGTSAGGRIVFHDFDGMFFAGYTYTFKLYAAATSTINTNGLYFMLFNSNLSAVETYSWGSGANWMTSIRPMADGSLEIACTFTANVDTALTIGIFTAQANAFDLYIEEISLTRFRETRSDFTFTADNVDGATVDFNKQKIDVTGSLGISTVGWVADENGIGFNVHTYDKTAGGLIRFNDLNQNVLTTGKTYMLTVVSTYIGPNAYLTLDKGGSDISVERKDLENGLYEYAFTFTYGGYPEGVAIFLAQQYERDFTVYSLKITEKKVRVAGNIATMTELRAPSGWLSDFDAKEELISNVGANQAMEWTNTYPESIDQDWFLHINLANYPYRVNLDFMKGIGVEDCYYSLTLNGSLTTWGNIYLLGFNASGSQVATIAGQNKGNGTVGFYFTKVDGIDKWAFFSTNQKFEMHVSQITLKAEDFAPIGVMDTTATQIIFPDVYNLDDFQFNAFSAIILDKGYVAVVDAGESASQENNFVLVNTLRSLGVTKIDALILTHPHGDHTGAMTYIIERFDVGTFYYKDTDYDAKATGSTTMEAQLQKILTALRAKQNSDASSPVLVEVNTFGQTASFGTNGQFTFWYNQKVFEGDYVADGNYFSLSFMYRSGDVDLAYFGGDLPDDPNYVDADQSVIDAASKAIIWQVNHHGSDGPYSSNELIAKVQPTYAFYSNPYTDFFQAQNSQSVGRLDTSVTTYYHGTSEVIFTLNADGTVTVSR